MVSGLRIGLLNASLDANAARAGFHLCLTTRVVGMICTGQGRAVPLKDADRQELKSPTRPNQAQTQRLMSAMKTSTATLLEFSRESTGHITVGAMLAGKPARFIVDTGAGSTCIHSGYLDMYKLSLSMKSKRGGGVGNTAMKMTTVAKHDLSLNGVDLSGFKLIAIDLSHVISALEKKKIDGIVGVIGADVLHRNHAVIDYARRIMVLSHQ